MNKPTPYVWNMTRMQYFHSMCRKRVLPVGKDESTFGWSIRGYPHEVFPYQIALDKCTWDREIGHFHIIARQVLRGKTLEIVTPKVFVDYHGAWLQFFRENPTLLPAIELHSDRNLIPGDEDATLQRQNSTRVYG